MSVRKRKREGDEYEEACHKLARYNNSSDSILTTQWWSSSQPSDFPTAIMMKKLFYDINVCGMDHVIPFIMDYCLDVSLMKLGRLMVCPPQNSDMKFKEFHLDHLKREIVLQEMDIETNSSWLRFFSLDTGVHIRYIPIGRINQADLHPWSNTIYCSMREQKRCVAICLSTGRQLRTIADAVGIKMMECTQSACYWLEYRFKDGKVKHITRVEILDDEKLSERKIHFDALIPESDQLLSFRTITSQQHDGCDEVLVKTTNDDAHVFYRLFQVNRNGEVKQIAGSNRNNPFDDTEDYLLIGDNFVTLDGKMLRLFDSATVDWQRIKSIDIVSRLPGFLKRSILEKRFFTMRFNWNDRELMLMNGKHAIIVFN